MPIDTNSKILVVDDLPDMREALISRLRALGYSNIITGANGAEALTLLDKNIDVTLVISDWNMEPVDGLELRAALRNDARFSALPFILVSAEAGPYRRNQAMEAGVSLFMAKPFDEDALREALETVSTTARL